MQIRLTKQDETRRIQGIKFIRIVSGMGLREAKELSDRMIASGGPSEWFDISPDYYDREAIERANAQCLEVAEWEFHRPEGPLPIHLLALKLSMHGMSKDQVIALADALVDVEDAEGSLRECARMMEQVEP